MAKQLKILVLGNSAVGKTALLRKFNDLEFEAAHIPTNSSDFSVSEVKLNHSIISVQFWDIGNTAALGKAFLRNTHGVVIVVDVTQPASLDNLDQLYDEVHSMASFADHSFPCILLGNKIDLADERRVSTDSLRAWARQKRGGNNRPISVFAVSAKTGTFVKDALQTVVKDSFEHPAQLLSLTTGMSDGSISRRTRSSVGSDISAASGKRSVASSALTSGAGRSTSDIDGDVTRETAAADAIAVKVVLAGMAGVGKTTLLKKFIAQSVGAGDDYAAVNIALGSSNSSAAGSNPPSLAASDVLNGGGGEFAYNPTVGADFRSAVLPARTKLFNMHLWDTSGDPSHEKICKTVYKNADCLILVFDLTDRSTFECLNNQWDLYLDYCNPHDPDGFPAVLVGNKSDVSERRAVTVEEAMQWCVSKRPKAPVTYIGNNKCKQFFFFFQLL